LNGMKEIIEDNNKVLAVVLRDGDWPQGLSFHTKDEDFLQIGTWNYPKGEKSSAHSHRIAERVSNRTNEVIYIKKGRVRAGIFSEKDNLVREVILGSGDLIVIFGGGHAFETLEEGTQVLEVKNGPYPGIEKDKRVVQVQF